MVTDPQLAQTWADIQRRLQHDLPDNLYRIWLSPMVPVALDESTLYLRVPTGAGAWIKRRFGAALSAAATTVDPSLHHVELVSEAVPVPSPHRREAPGLEQPPSGVLLSGHTFEHFVIGEGNRFAHAAALTVAELPAHAYNPLFVFGPAGTGKTHLLQAIGNYLTQQDPGLDIRYATVEGFTTDFLRALKHEDTESFKLAYRRPNVLLLDDVQFLEGKQRTAEEFFYTLDAVSNAGGQIVLAGDRHPSTMPLIEARLRERLQSGLLVDLHPPDQATRLGILEKLAQSSDAPAGDAGVLAHLAARAPANVNILKGAFVRVVAFASLTGSELTLESTDRVIASLYEPGSGRVERPHSGQTVRQIQERTCGALEVSVDDLYSPKRGRRVVYARQVAMYLARELTNLSLPAIARQFGGRDHTTVLHAHKKIQRQLLTDASTRRLVTSLIEDASAPQ